MARLSPIASALGVTVCCAVLSACGGDDGALPTPSPRSASPAPVATENTPAPAPPAPPAPEPARVVRLGAGFTPDPWVMDAEVVGTVDAHTLDEGCAGWLSSTPNMLFDADTAITELYLMAHTREGDLSLVVQGPDGSFRCAASAEDRGPTLSGFFAAGRHKVWVGVSTEGRARRFRLGLSELSETTPSSLESAPLAP